PLPRNHPTARNAEPFGLLSALATPPASIAASSVATTVPRPTIPISLPPRPLQPRRLHASEVVHDLLNRQLHEFRLPDVRQADETDPPRGGLLVDLHGERERRGRETPRDL